MLSDSVLSILFSTIVFIVFPIILSILEYRITNVNKKQGLYILVGVFLSSIILGLYSLILGVLLTVIYLLSTYLLKIGKN